LDELFQLQADARLALTTTLSSSQHQQHSQMLPLQCYNALQIGGWQNLVKIVGKISTISLFKVGNATLIFTFYTTFYCFQCFSAGSNLYIQV